uniref:Uncharacterized protein n=1 Tax=Arundo donax TaxID=35708 RepID=A0A0A9B1I0_ARUDO
MKGPSWAIQDSLITVGGRIYVSASSPNLPQILAQAHIGHEGVQRTLHRLRLISMFPMTKPCFKILCAIVPHVNATKLATFIQQVCCNLFRCQIRFAVT